MTGRECQQHDDLIVKVAEIDERTRGILEIVLRLELRQQSLARALAKYSGIGVAIAAVGAIALKLLGIDVGPTP
jgi:hypothetical protein